MSIIVIIADVAHSVRSAYTFDVGVFPKWSRNFIEFSEFRETDKSLKHELGEH